MRRHLSAVTTPPAVVGSTLALPGYLVAVGVGRAFGVTVTRSASTGRVCRQAVVVEKAAIAIISLDELLAGARSVVFVAALGIVDCTEWVAGTGLTAVGVVPVEVPKAISAAVAARLVRIDWVKVNTDARKFIALTSVHRHSSCNSSSRRGRIAEHGRDTASNSPPLPKYSSRQTEPTHLASAAALPLSP